MSWVLFFSAVCFQISKTLFMHTFTLEFGSSGSDGFIHLWSSPIFLPSTVSLHILSSVGSTAPARIIFARSPRFFIIFDCIFVAGTLILCISKSGLSRFNVAAVLISAHSLNMFISSGRFWNLAKRVFIWYLPFASGDSSIDVVVSPKIDAQRSKLFIPSSLSLSACKYRISVYISDIELLIGVPLAKITPLPPVTSSRYRHFIRSCIDLPEPPLPMPDTFCIFVGVSRFLYAWDSSTKILSIPSCSKLSISSLGVFSRSFWILSV